jgi:hypothetical protein
MLTETAEGWVSVTLLANKQPLASVAVTVCTPAESPVAKEVVWLPAEADQRYVMAPVPPELVATMEPLVFPKQVGFVLVKDVLMALGSVKVTQRVAEQPFKSVTETQ